MYKSYDEMTVKEKYYLHLGRYLTWYYDRKTRKYYYNILK